MKKLIILLSLSTLILCSSTYNTKIFGKKSTIENYWLFNVFIIKPGEMSFEVTDKKPVNSDFYINSNFFTENNNPIGLVVINSKRKSNKTKGGGFFYVKNNKPHVKSKNCPRNTKYASQTILWAIDDGAINKSLIKQPHANQLRYRSLIGQTKNDDIIIISSNRLGLVTIKDLLDFSDKYNIVDGILLDGGSSVDYKFMDNNQTISFMSIPIGLKSFTSIGSPTTYIHGNFN